MVYYSWFHLSNFISIFQQLIPTPGPKIILEDFEVSINLHNYFAAKKIKNDQLYPPLKRFEVCHLIVLILNSKQSGSKNTYKTFPLFTLFYYYLFEFLTVLFFNFVLIYKVFLLHI